MSSAPIHPIAHKVVGITGAARGIGAAIAACLVRDGARVAIGDIDGDAARETAHRLGTAELGLELDVTSTESFGAFLDETERMLGPIDVLINNAGIMWVGPFAEEPETTAVRQFDVNFHGVARGMRLVLPRMRERGSGHVINIASAASKVAPSGEATYAATKHAVHGYSAAVRAELRGSPIRISVVMPGVVETELAAGTSHGRGKRLQPNDVAEAVVSVLVRPRFEVFVPASIGALTRVSAVLPERARDRMAHALVPDQVAATDRSIRTQYEGRTVGAGNGAPRP
jgi:NADP-dependent 3-hydroxy acid dehydrogenase YdfG